jgi:glucose-1-phosphate cytidylyltransferase
MKVAILAGGMGTRLREETEYRPKPMVEIGDRPILWHIMKTYAAYGYKDFVICLGYKGDVIRDYFFNYHVRNCDVTLTLGRHEFESHGSHAEDGWRVTLAETGKHTMTGGRLKLIRRHLGSDAVMVTYGDGVADIDIEKLVKFHQSQGKLATVTAVRPQSRYGELITERGMVTVFREKPPIHEGWVNGGFFVFEPAAFDFIGNDDEPLEGGMLARLADSQQLAAYHHEGFWQCMDTFREMQMLNELWNQGGAPWAIWRNCGP